MTARARKVSAPAVTTPQLFVVVDAVTGELHQGGRQSVAIGSCGYERVAFPVFTSEDDAWEALEGGSSAMARAINRERWRVIPLIAVMPAPPRETAWGPGQFDDLDLGPAGKVSLRVTDQGRLRMLIPGGDHDVTEISASLGTGLHEGGARAAQIRTRLADRAARRSRR